MPATSRPSASARQSISATDLPTREDPLAPLNPTYCRGINELTAQFPVSKVDAELERALKLLAECAADINDISAERALHADRRLQKRQAAAAAGGGDDDVAADVSDDEWSEFKSNVETMTARMEESVRKAIDGRKAAEDMARVMQGIRETCTSESNAARYQQEMRAAARGTGRSQRLGHPDEESDDEASPPPRRQFSSASHLFAEKTTAAAQTYMRLPLRTRYADHNDYIQFKQHVWSAQHPGDDAPLPAHHTWFEDSGSPAAGTAGNGAARGQDDSDDDVEVLRGTISTRCPITLLEFKDPVTSKTCRHTFEKDAILSMMPTAPVGRGRRGFPVPLKCPVGGCEKTFVKEDLHRDEALVRKIRQIQAARAEDEDDEDESGDGDGMDESAV